MTHCETHPTEEAAGACAGCGRFMCHACNHGVGRLLCRICVDREASKPEPSPRAPAPTAPTRVIVRPSASMGSSHGHHPYRARPEKKRDKRLFWIAIALTWWAWASWGWLGLTVGVPLFGVLAYRRRRLQGLDDQEDFEARALATYRAIEGETVTKDTLVRHHGFSPEDADRTLTWLASQELLEADWTDMEGPLTYTRNT